MAVTEDRLTQPAAESLEERASTLERSPERSAPPDDVRARWSRVLLVGWIAGFGGLIAFEPVPDDASISAAAALISTLFLFSLGATLAGLGTNRNWGLKASAVTAGVGVIVAAACAQTGHHAGAWWAVELAVFGAMLGLTRMAGGANS